MIKFNTIDPELILQIVKDINNKIPYNTAMKTHNISVYYIKKICRHFGGFTDIKNIKAELKSIDIDNKTPYHKKRDTKANYLKHRDHNLKYAKRCRLINKVKRIMKFLNDNADIINKEKIIIKK